MRSLEEKRLKKEEELAAERARQAEEDAARIAKAEQRQLAMQESKRVRALVLVRLCPQAWLSDFATRLLPDRRMLLSLCCAPSARRHFSGLRAR